MLTFWHWVAMTLGFVVAGLAGLKAWEKLQDRKRAREFPEKPCNRQ